MDKNSELIELMTQTMEKISEALNEREVFRIVEDLLKDISSSEFATLFIFDREKQILYSEKDIPIEIDVINPEGLLGISFLTKKSTIHNYIASEKYYLPNVDNPRRVRLRSQLIVPIIDDDNLIAIVRVCRSIYTTKHFTSNETNLIKTLSCFIGEVIRKLKPDDDYEMNVNPSKIKKEIHNITKESSGNNDINSTMLFLANTVHDIRTPANSLYGFLEILEEYTEDTRLKEFIEAAKESASFINTLTDSILEQVKERHEIETTLPQVVNSIKFFSHIGDQFSANMCKKNISYMIYICPNIPKEIKIDRLKVKRIIINLIGNAYKFTPSNEKIVFEVKCNVETKELNISIKDTGLGINKSRQKDIFKSFEQAEKDTKQHFGGTGLGLAILSKYVHDLGGVLELDSLLDEGSNFYFNLPFETITPEPSQEPIIGQQDNIIILTDDLDDANAKNIRDYLTKLGISKKDIVISDEFDSRATHIFSFEHKVTSEILDIVEKNGIKLVIVEEILFSLSTREEYKSIDIISINTYYGDKIHSAVFAGKKIKILIADDNQINITLLKAMLETEYCMIDVALDGKTAFDKLADAQRGDNLPFDMIFLDEHMPSISGSKILGNLRIIERDEGKKAIFAVSITGDPNMSQESKALYNLSLNKPFRKDDIRRAVKVCKESI